MTWLTCMHGVRMKACGFDRCSESLQLTACDVTFACCRAMIGDLQGSRRSVHLSILLFILMCVSAKPAGCCGSHTQIEQLLPCGCAGARRDGATHGPGRGRAHAAGTATAAAPAAGAATAAAPGAAAATGQSVLPPLLPPDGLQTISQRFLPCLSCRCLWAHCSMAQCACLWPHSRSRSRSRRGRSDSPPRRARSDSPRGRSRSRTPASRSPSPIKSRSRSPAPAKSVSKSRSRSRS